MPSNTFALSLPLGSSSRLFSLLSLVYYYYYFLFNVKVGKEGDEDSTKETLFGVSNNIHHDLHRNLNFSSTTTFGFDI